MKLATLAILVALSLPAIAQQQPTQEQALNAKLADQRNAAQNESALCYAQASVAVAELQKKLADANAELAKLKPKDETKK